MSLSHRFLFCSLLLVGEASAGSAAVGGPPAAVRNASSVTWLGLDYTRVQMVGMRDFEEPESIFPGYLHKWNGLVLEEQMDDLSVALGKPVSSSINRARERNETVAPAIVREFADDARVVSSRLTRADLEAVATGYAGVGQGVGLVFIVDELLKEREVGCMNPTFVDISSGEILYTYRTCQKVQGFGFRNYWFNPVKATIKDMGSRAKRW